MAAMATTIHLPFADTDPTLRFPDRCVWCGQPKQAESVLVLNRLVMRGRRQVAVSGNLKVPHCQQCARATKSIFWSGFVPYLLGFLLVGIAAFAVVTYGASVLGLDNYGRPEQAPSLMLGIFAGLVGGIAGGLLFEVLARVILVPFLGTRLLHAPFMAMQLLRDSDYVVGLYGKLNREGTRYELSFANDEVAREFEALNAATPPTGDKSGPVRPRRRTIRPTDT
jgi:hypothetical protein